VTLTFNFLTLKVVSESRDVGYLFANFGLPRPSVLGLGPMYTSDRRQTKHHLMPPPLPPYGGGDKKNIISGKAVDS